jgi:hypothetical protein
MELRFAEDIVDSNHVHGQLSHNGKVFRLCEAMWKEHARGMGEVQSLAEIFFCASPFMDFQEKNGSYDLLVQYEEFSPPSR